MEVGVINELLSIFLFKVSFSFLILGLTLYFLITFNFKLSNLFKGVLIFELFTKLLKGKSEERFEFSKPEIFSSGLSSLFGDIVSVLIVFLFV